jgi:hypothetical protein
MFTLKTIKNQQTFLDSLPAAFLKDYDKYEGEELIQFLFYF